MRRLLIARMITTFIGLVVWGYGTAANISEVRVTGMVVLAIALLMRFAPKRWFGDESA